MIRLVLARLSRQAEQLSAKIYFALRLKQQPLSAKVKLHLTVNSECHTITNCPDPNQGG